VLVGKIADTTSPVKFTYTVARQNLFGSLQGFGFTNATVENQEVSMPVLITLGGNEYAANALLIYAAKQGKTGAAK